MAEVTMILDSYEEKWHKVALLYDAEWVHLDDRHVWQLVIGLSGSGVGHWIGPYWTDAELMGTWLGG